MAALMSTSSLPPGRGAPEGSRADPAPMPRRLAFHAISATLLFLALLVLVNAIAWRFPLRVRFGDAASVLSDRTRDAIRAHRGAPLEIDCVMNADHPLFDAVRARLTAMGEMTTPSTGVPLDRQPLPGFARRALETSHDATPSPLSRPVRRL